MQAQAVCYKHDVTKNERKKKETNKERKKERKEKQSHVLKLRNHSTN